jgi:putative endonuclease
MATIKQPAVYMMASGLRGTLYVGVTSDLVRRDYEHKHGIVDGFTKKHGCKLLVWYELHETMESVILREKQLKAGSRKKKITHIEKENPFWYDLSPSIQN